MHPKLIKLSIAKHTLLPREALMHYLDHLDRLDVMPERRCEADAVRIATTYWLKYSSAAVSLWGSPQECLHFGEQHLFETDLRRVAYALVAEEVELCWPGIWVCLTHAPALSHVATLDTIVTAGSVTLRTLMLANSQGNREVIAEELGRQYTMQIRLLQKRLHTPKANGPAVEQEYQRLCQRIRTAEQTLGVPIPGLEEQVSFEAALATACGFQLALDGMAVDTGGGCAYTR